ncbi:Carbon monoxide dehydrogenase subunit G (fragment) [Sterolibacterium denitrificans]|uniref:Carbon monoxide dehydrogenase subunit G n=1 Tax=Sterolibacterium denitrificans TaxID=157592 RepID=A0A7Z7MVR5_9PROT
MAIEMKESFQVAAPIGKVWDFMMKPEMVVACMPGAGLKEIVSPEKFIGTVKLKVGAVTAQYEGTITYAEVDEAARRLNLLAEGNERGGGTATATIACQLVSIEGGTDVQFESSVDLTGKLIQVGRGMIEGVAGQIVKKYIANVRKMLEVETPADGAAPASVSAAASSAAGEAAAQTAPAAAPPQEDSINMGAIVFKALWMSIVGFFGKLFGGKKTGGQASCSK